MRTKPSPQRVVIQIQTTAEALQEVHEWQSLLPGPVSTERVQVGWAPTGVESECSGKVSPGSPTEQGAAPTGQRSSHAGPRMPEQLLSGARFVLLPLLTLL